MKRAILIHGWNTKEEFFDMSRPTASNDHWFPWLTKQLIVKDIHTVSLEMPNGFYPQYEVWKRELERFEIDSDTTLVGHSCGGGFIVRWLSETMTKVDKVILVAPWLGIGASDDAFDQSFFDFEIDPRISSLADSFSVYVSSDDMQDVVDSVHVLREKLPEVSYREFENKGHFTLKSLGSEEFPELFEELTV